MLSMPGGIKGLFSVFEVDAETMRYDEEKMRADIEKYGLFTYEEFAELVPVSQERKKSGIPDFFSANCLTFTR